ncbi:MAG: hypothetical protein JXA97_03460 [Anaerolineales bacterium]|nr:hypothetical protein [Anaerolineales bacterium]
MSETPSPAQLGAAAMKAYQRGDHAAAAEGFKAAETAFKATGDDHKAAEMANNRSVALLDANPREAFNAATGTPAIFERSGKLLQAAQAYGNIAAALEALNELEQARDHYRLCAKLLSELGATELQAAALQSLSKVQLKLGQPLPALAAMESGLELQPRKGIRNRLLRRMLRIPGRMLKR